MELAEFFAANGIPRLRITPFTPIKRVVQQLGDAFERDGDVVQVTGFSARIFCFRNPEHVETILRHQPVGETKYPRVLPRVKWVMGDGGYILLGGRQWRERRARVQSAFKGQCLRHYAEQVPEVVAPMLDRWVTYAETASPFDICKELQSLVTQISFKIFFSEELSGNTLQRIRDQTHFVEFNFVRASPLWFPSLKNLRFRRYTRELRQVMRRLVLTRKAQPRETQDLLSTLLRLSYPGAKGSDPAQSWSDDDIVDEMFSVYFGASVMSTTLAWCMYLVATHASVQERLIDEIRDVLRGRRPSIKDLSALSYGDSVLQETLRLYPPSWGYPRYCEQGMEINEYRIPEKSLVIPIVYHSHRHPDYWDRPEEFDPDRFAPGGKAKIHRFAHYPFGGGPRTCLGANLAPIVLRLVLTMVFQRFRIEFKPRFAEDPLADFGFEIHPRDGVQMVVRSA